MPPVSILLTLKYIHIASVALSYTLFLLRGIWMLRASALLQLRWVRTAPHLVDSLLLASAVALAWQLGVSPLAAPWLAAKIVALPVYIVVGAIALKYGKTRRTRLFAWLAAQLLFLYIVSVAVTHSPAPWRS
jgi:uncharacterized membrane protein SirB2